MSALRKYKSKIIINTGLKIVVCCSKCNLIPFNAFSENDGKIYCKACANHSKNKKPNKAIQMVIENLDICCPNSVKDNDSDIIFTSKVPNCNWKGKFKDIDTHLIKSCELVKRVCKYNKVGCKHANKMYGYELNNHYKQNKDKHHNLYVINIDKIIDTQSKYDHINASIISDLKEQIKLLTNKLQITNELKEDPVPNDANIDQKMSDDMDSANELCFNQQYKSSNLQFKLHNTIVVYHSTVSTRTTLEKVIVNKMLYDKKQDIKLKIKYSGNLYNSVYIGIIEYDKIRVWYESTQNNGDYGIWFGSSNKIIVGDKSWEKGLFDDNVKHKSLTLNQTIYVWNSKYKNYRAATILNKTKKGIKTHWNGGYSSDDKYIEINEYHKIRLNECDIKYSDHVVTMVYDFDKNNNNKPYCNFMVKDKEKKGVKFYLKSKTKNAMVVSMYKPRGYGLKAYVNAYVDSVLAKGFSTRFELFLVN